jgi:molybdopterin-guanine dinucleotide biosynthesis protein A
VRSAAIVLAGGASSRFGGDKLAAVYLGRPVLHHALASAAAVADPVVLVLAPGAPLPALPAGLDRSLLIARDAVAHQGPLAGLAGGLAALPAGVERAIVVAGDMPALVPAVLRALLDAIGPDAGVAVASLEADPTSPLPMAVRPSLAGPAITALLAADRRSLRALLEAVPSVVVPAATWRRLDPDAATLRDVDTPGDLSGR